MQSLYRCILFVAVRDHSYWIGGHRRLHNMSWCWGMECNPIAFSDWSPGEPNNLGGNERCIEQWPAARSYQWNDTPCSGLDVYICEKEATTD